MCFYSIRLQFFICLRPKTKKNIIVSLTYMKYFAGSSDKEQLTYTETRLQDLENVKEVKTSTRSSESLLVTIQQGNLKADSKEEESLAVYVVFQQVNITTSSPATPLNHQRWKKEEGML